jgi:outer membrane immunogenic protein
MKRQLMLGVAFGALTAVTPAMAQPQRLPPAAATAVFNWTGFYVGVNAGYSWGTGDWTYYQPGLTLCCGLPSSTGGSHSVNGAIGGLQAGYNFQAGMWVMGAVTDFDWSSEKGSSNFAYSAFGEGFSGTVTTKIESLGTVRANFGPLIAQTVWVYATGGFAYGRVNAFGAFALTCGGGCGGMWSFSQSQTRTGPAVGIGVQGSIPNWPSLKWMIEYLYVDFGTITVNGIGSFFGSGPYTFTDHVTDNIVRAGVNMKIPP